MATSKRRWAVLFPGQGSQAVGMGRDLAQEWPEAAEVFTLADEVLGEGLSKICFEGPEEALRLTRNTQPALLTVSVAAWRVLSSRVSVPVAGAGHSLGEYSALVAAGVLKFEDALRAVRLRGEAMQEAVPVGVGAMAAIIGAQAPAVEELCLRVCTEDEVLVPANFNAPGQIVIAGHAAAVERFVAQAREIGARRAIPLPVSAPFHSPLMEPAAERLSRFLEGVDFGEAAFPVLANVDAAPTLGGAEAREKLVRQVASPVRWIDTMALLESEFDATRAVEVGVGKVLAGLSRKINQDLKVAGFAGPEDLEGVLAALG